MKATDGGLLVHQSLVFLNRPLYDSSRHWPDGTVQCDRSEPWAGFVVKQLLPLSEEGITSVIVQFYGLPESPWFNPSTLMRMGPVKKQGICALQVNKV
jgi:hypothetical protein